MTQRAIATQSSVAFDGFPENVLKSTRSSGFAHARGSCSHTEAEQGAQFRVELEESFEIDLVTVLNRGDCCRERCVDKACLIANSPVVL